LQAIGVEIGQAIIVVGFLLLIPFLKREKTEEKLAAR
jgi:hypothetical protein